MRKRIIICALSVFLLILSGVLAFYLHGQNRPIAGLSGDNRTLLRVWMLHSPGGAARWVETQLSAYERQHPGVLIYLRQVSADELTAEETLLPDVVLYRPGDIPDPDGLFLPISGDAPIFAGLLSGGRQVAYPLCWGAWVLAVDSAYDPQTAATPARRRCWGAHHQRFRRSKRPRCFRWRRRTRQIVRCFPPVDARCTPCGRFSRIRRTRAGRTTSRSCRPTWCTSASGSGNAPRRC
jgi:hypothetical protein